MRDAYRTNWTFEQREAVYPGYTQTEASRKYCMAVVRREVPALAKAPAGTRGVFVIEEDGTLTLTDADAPADVVAAIRAELARMGGCAPLPPSLSGTNRIEFLEVLRAQ